MPSRQPEAGPLRVYQKWQGKEVFFCGGRLVAGPNWKSLFGTSLLILAPLVAYTLLVGEVLMDELHFAFPLVGLLLGILALAFLFITGCMDPGILKRQEPDDEFLDGRKPKTSEVTVNGHQVLVRYNETCHFYQPPRAHHCSVNDNCIKKFDHHCPWVGTTIGLRNYRFFLSFIFTASLLCIYVCATAVLAIKLEYDNLESADRDLKEAFEAAPAAIAVCLYAALFFLFVGGLSFFHIYLVSTNQTTYENFRYGYDREHNPYNEGCFRNCWSVWCLPIPKPEVNFRDHLPMRISGGSSTTTRTSIFDDDSQREHPKSYSSRSRTDMEMESYGGGSYGIRGDVTIPPPPRTPTWDAVSMAQQHSTRHLAGSRESARNAQYIQRPLSAAGPGADSGSIQVIQPGISFRDEAHNNTRRYYSEGPEIRMFPGRTANSFRPTTVPNQDGVTSRPRPATKISNNRRPR